MFTLAFFIYKMEIEEKIEVHRPPLIWSITEVGRALVEWSISVPFKMLQSSEDTGDGHPVMILPGFLATDASTVPLRNFVHECGYKVYGWGEGRNYANEEYISLLNEKIDFIYKKHNQAISLIGWSLGGIYARQLAKAKPNKIRQLITLGSPFKDVIKSNNAKWMYDLLRRGEKNAAIDPELLNDIPLPAPVPTTAIYSKEDGIVPWQLCMEQEETPIHQNIQVRGSHFGLGVNAAVMAIIADRLQYDERNWEPFQSDGILKEIFMYPSLAK